MDRLLRPWLQHPRFDNDAGGGGGTAPAGDVGNPGGNQNVNANDGGNPQGNENNSSDNSPDFSTMWDVDDEGQQQQQTQQQQGNQNQQQNSAEAVNAFIDRAVGQMAFTPEMLQDPEAFNAQMQQMQAGIMRNMLSTMSRYVASQRDAIIEAAVQQSTGNVNADIVIERMNEALPFTGKPEIAPMANRVLNQFLSKGQSPKQAIKSTEAYFKKLGAEASGTPTNQQLPGTGNFNSRGGQVNGIDTEDIDWEAALGQ